MPRVNSKIILKLNTFLSKLTEISNVFKDFELTPLMVSGENEIEPYRIIFKLTGYIRKRDYDFLREHLKPLGFAEVKQRDIRPYFMKHDFTPEKETIKIKMLQKDGNPLNKLVVEISGFISLLPKDIKDFRTFLNPFTSLTPEQESGVLSRWVTLGKLTE